jgi:hypothetical protein
MTILEVISTLDEEGAYEVQTKLWRAVADTALDLQRRVHGSRDNDISRW